jgi:hypothetical protein
MDATLMRVYCIGKKLEGNGCGPVEVLLLNLPGGTEKTMKKLRIHSFQAEIRTQHFPITTPERYHYTK